MDNPNYSRLLDKIRCLDRRYIHIGILTSIAVCYVATIISLIAQDYGEHNAMKYFHINLILLNTGILCLAIFSHLRTVYANRQSIQIPISVVLILQLLVCCIGIYSLFSGTPLSAIPFATIVTICDIIVFGFLSVVSVIVGVNPQENPLQSTHRQYALAATSEFDDDDTDVELQLDMYLNSDQPYESSQSRSHITGQSAGGNSQLHGTGLSDLNTLGPDLSNGITGRSLHGQIDHSIDDFDLSDEYTDTY